MFSPQSLSRNLQEKISAITKNWLTHLKTKLKKNLGVNMKNQRLIKTIIKNVLFASGLILSAFLLSACGSSQRTLAVGDTAPDFRLTAADNSVISLNDFTGKPVLLYFHMAMG